MIDRHVHVINPARFPYAGCRGYRPRADETGTRKNCAGFRAVLALGREGNAAMKLSAPFRHKRLESGDGELASSARELLDAFGIERCVWGPDWPFINTPRGLHYADMLCALESRLPEAPDRKHVIEENSRRLSGSVR